MLGKYVVGLAKLIPLHAPSFRDAIYPNIEIGGPGGSTFKTILKKTCLYLVAKLIPSTVRLGGVFPPLLSPPGQTFSHFSCEVLSLPGEMGHHQRIERARRAHAGTNARDHWGHGNSNQTKEWSPTWRRERQKKYLGGGGWGPWGVCALVCACTRASAWVCVCACVCVVVCACGWPGFEVRLGSTGLWGPAVDSSELSGHPGLTQHWVRLG